MCNMLLKILPVTLLLSTTAFSPANGPMTPKLKSTTFPNQTIKTLSLSPASYDIANPVFDEQCDEIGITLTRYMLELVTVNPHLRELDSLLMAIQYACKGIANTVDRAPIKGLTGLQNGGGSINAQGEEQKKLDVLTNNILKKAMRFTGRVGVIASEEEDVPLSVNQKSDRFRLHGLRTTQFKTDVN
mmetsp:Transcript_22956/g.23176  ORF Transcript_22956/g.23176 Transcript_22956/m.23176 type:complete len:187 (+) Transcript_22956:20-580(+)